MFAERQVPAARICSKDAWWRNAQETAFDLTECALTARYLSLTCQDHNISIIVFFSHEDMVAGLISSENELCGEMKNSFALSSVTLYVQINSNCPDWAQKVVILKIVGPKMTPWT